MSRKKVDLIWLIFSIFFFLTFSVSFVLMPLESEKPTENISLYTMVAGLMFWISIVMGIVTQCILAYRRRAWYVANRVRKIRAAQKIGLISFFKNIYAIIADVCAILSLIGLVIALIATSGSGYVCYIFISLFVFSFSMHCILNGKVFYYVVNQNKLLKAIEKERANSSKQERKELNG